MNVPACIMPLPRLLKPVPCVSSQRCRMIATINQGAFGSGHYRNKVTEQSSSTKTVSLKNLNPFFVKCKRKYGTASVCPLTRGVHTKTNQLICRIFSTFDSPERSSSPDNEGDADIDFLSVAEEVLVATRRIDIMADSVPIETVVELLQHLSSAGLSLVSAVRLLSGRMWLLQQASAVGDIVDTLSQHGFESQVVLGLLRDLPLKYHVGELPLSSVPQVIEASLSQLRAVGFSTKSLSEMVESYPPVLLTDGKTLRSIFTKLKGPFTAADAVKVSQTCPQVFARSWEETNEIFDYAYFTMGYPQSKIVTSKLLACDLTKLQDRHAFLVRVGQFVKVKQKDDPRLNPNPPLRLVVGASDTQFAAEFGGVSLAEYNTFLDMREVERETEAQSSDDDSDSE